MSVDKSVNEVPQKQVLQWLVEPFPVVFPALKAHQGWLRPCKHLNMILRRPRLFEDRG